MDKDIVLRVEGLKKYFPIRRGVFKRIVGNIKAVDNISFDIYRGETLGVVGESGCGKTTTARSIFRGIEPTAGEVLFRKKNNEVVNIVSLEKRKLKKLRKEMQMIFQDPYSSLNPRLTIKDIVGDPLYVNRIARGKELENRVGELLEKVGLTAKYMSRYPHAFSGGQRQRIAIARALSVNPQFVACDESVSALDVSVQAQILNLLRTLQQEMELTYLFIAHDLSVIKHICDRVVVMYVGKIVEIAETEELFNNPKHPYTEALLSAVPKTEPDLSSHRIVLEGEVPDLSDPPAGCHFHPRCKYAEDICREKEPQLNDKEKHPAACFFYDRLSLEGIKEIEHV